MPTPHGRTAPRTTIRERRPDDRPGCVEMLAKVHVADSYPMVWMADPAAWLDLPDRLGAWVAEVDGELAGHVVLTPVTRPDLGPEALEAKRLFVVPSRRGLGIGAALLATAIGRANPRPVVVEVVAGTGAVAVYEHLGWREVTRRRAAWKDAHGAYPVMIWYAAP